METQVYKVRDPQGNLRQIRGPVGATDEEIIAQAKKLFAAPESAPAESPTSAKNIAAAAIEPNLSLLSGAIATPIAGWAGAATGMGNLLGLTKEDPGEVVRKVQGAMTYQPKTEGGKNAMAAISYLPEKWSQAADFMGDQAVERLGSPLLGTAWKTGMEMLPAALGMKSTVGGSTLPLSSGVEKVSRSLMQSALKPSKKDVLSGNADKAITTLLDEGVNVTSGGRNALWDKVGSLDDQLTKAIAGSNATVSKAAVADRLRDVMKTFESQVNPTADMAAIEKSWTEFLNHPKLQGDKIPVQLAQELKRGTYKMLKDKYGQMGNAETEAQKGLARGLKEEVASSVPEAGPLNDRQSALINAANMVGNRLAVEGNKNPFGLALLAADNPAKIAFLLDRSAAAKSLAARALNPGEFLPTGDAVMASGASDFASDSKNRQNIIDALLRGQQ